jgi:hypothetical protein
MEGATHGHEGWPCSDSQADPTAMPGLHRHTEQLLIKVHRALDVGNGNLETIDFFDTQRRGRLREQAGAEQTARQRSEQGSTGECGLFHCKWPGWWRMAGMVPRRLSCGPYAHGAAA